LSEDTILRIVRGESDVAVTLGASAAQAAKALDIYQKGGGKAIRRFALALRPRLHFYNMLRADLDLRSFADIARGKSKLNIQVGKAAFGLRTAI